VKAETAGTYRLVWRYAFGGLAANTRDAKLAINGSRPPTRSRSRTRTTGTCGQETPALAAQLAAGANFIQLAALGASGLANIDHLQILGDGLTPDNPSFSLTVANNDAAAGSVSWTPVQLFYPRGPGLDPEGYEEHRRAAQRFTTAVQSADASSNYTVRW
jgi:hypothetical protein